MAKTRRMLIEDIDLMIGARRRLLAYAVRASEQEELLAPDLAEAAGFLRLDERLDGPIFVEMEVDPDFDKAMRVALAFEREQLPKGPQPLQGESSDVPLWLEDRLDAIERLRARLGED